MPDVLKVRRTTSLLKKSNLDSNEAGFDGLSSRLESARRLESPKESTAAKRVIANLDDYNSLPDRQSAYRCFHLTETRLPGIVSDLIPRSSPVV